MLFDEPTSALDPELVGEVLRGDARSCALRHDDDGGDARTGLRARSGRCAHSSWTAGAIVERGHPRDVLSTPPEPRTREFLSRVLYAMCIVAVMSERIRCGDRCRPGRHCRGCGPARPPTWSPGRKLRPGMRRRGVFGSKALTAWPPFRSTFCFSARRTVVADALGCTFIGVVRWWMQRGATSVLASSPRAAFSVRPWRSKRHGKLASPPATLAGLPADGRIEVEPLPSTAIGRAARSPDIATMLERPPAPERNGAALAQARARGPVIFPGSSRPHVRSGSGAGGHRAGGAGSGAGPKGSLPRRGRAA